MTSRHRYHHGKTPAAIWGSLIAAVGFIVLAVGFLLPFNIPVIVIGAGLVLLAVIVGGILRAVGLGQ